MLLELLAAVQSVDPMAIPLWAVLVVAAGMYPIGIMLGAQCSPCCNCGCPPGEELPDKITVTFNNITQSAVKTGDLIALSITSCFGAGAEGTVDAAGGLPAVAGPVTAVSLTNGGSGYAVLGRVQPQGDLTVSGSGAGAQFTVTLEPTTDACGLPAWQIASVAVTEPGEGYTDQSPLTITLAEGTFEQTPAALTLNTVPTEATITAVVPPGSGDGAALTVVTKKVSTSPDRWGVDTVTVDQGGEYYNDEDEVVFTAAETDVVVTQATGKVRTRRDQPPVVFDYKTGGGSGATFTAIVQETTVGGLKYYEVESVTITNGGSGYSNGSKVYFRTTGPRNYMDVQARFAIVADGSGVITSLTQEEAGKYWRDSGVVESVTVTNPGSYYGPSSSAGTVTIVDAGKYYSEDATIPPHVAEVTVAITQIAPSAGSGAEITASVNSTVGSPDFGKITGLTMTSAGSGYLKWSYDIYDCCNDRLNGIPFLLERKPGGSCEHYVSCCNDPQITVTYKGRLNPPSVTLGGIGGGACRVVFEASQDDAPFACDPLAFTATDVFGSGTATVATVEDSAVKADYPCPGVCTSVVVPEGEQYPCSQETCETMGGQWVNPYECSGPCVQCGTPQSMIVTIEVQLQDWVATLFEPPPYTGYWELKSETYTLTLGDEAGWAQQTGDYDSGAFGNAVGARASLYLGGGENMTQAACTVEARAATPLWSRYITQVGSNALISRDFLTGPVVLSNIEIPRRDSCFISGGQKSFNFPPQPSPISSGPDPLPGLPLQFPVYGMQVTVTVVT